MLRQGFPLALNIRFSAGGRSYSQHANCRPLKPTVLESPFNGTCPMHTIALIMLLNWHLDTPHLLGGQIILAKEKRSLEQILNWMFFPKN